MIAPKNSASCPEYTPRDIGRCPVAPLAHHIQHVEDSYLTLELLVRVGACSTFWITTKLGACVCYVKCTPGSKQRRLATQLYSKKCSLVAIDCIQM